MNTKRFILAGCATIILSAGAAQAGPCDTAGRAASAKDAGSGPTVGNTGQTTGTSKDVSEHPPDQHDESCSWRCRNVFAGCPKTDAGPAYGGAASSRCRALSAGG
jgi:hypothetical protein